MTKNEFLDELLKNLSPLSIKDKEKTISYYQELIDDQLESGEDENKIILNLGEPALIANKIKDELSQKDQSVEKNSTKSNTKINYILAIILGFPIWFSLLATIFAVILSIFVSIYAVLVSLFASTFAIGIFGLVQIFASFYYFTISATYAFSILGMGLVACGLSILLYFTSLHLSKYTLKFTAWFYNKSKKICVSIFGGKNVKKN